MKVFSVLEVPDGGDCLGTPDDPDPKIDYLQIDQQLGAESPILDRWEPIPQEFFQEEGSSQQDFYRGDGRPIVSAGAVALVQNIEGLELLPIGKVINLPSYCSSDVPFGYLFHFTSRLKLLPGSEVHFFPGTNSISAIDKMVLSLSDVTKRPVFQVQRNPVSVFCTSEFVDKVRASGASGLVFEPVSCELKD